MRKVIKIGDREYSIKSSAYTQFKYRDDTGRRLLDDIQEVSNIRNLSESEQISKTDDIIELLLKIAYIMIQEADEKQVSSFEEFLKEIDELFDNPEWINDVIEAATAPISGGLYKDPQQRN